jgi:hypothetical protein
MTKGREALPEKEAAELAIWTRGVTDLCAYRCDEKRLLFGNYCPWKHRPPLCHLDRSEA